MLMLITAGHRHRTDPQSLQAVKESKNTRWKEERDKKKKTRTGLELVQQFPRTPTSSAIYAIYNDFFFLFKLLSSKKLKLLTCCLVDTFFYPGFLLLVLKMWPNT